MTNVGRGVSTETRDCPRCDSPMVLRTAGRGRYEGQKFWGCSTYPQCGARVDVELESPDEIGVEPEWSVSLAGGSAQAEFERRRARNRERIRRQSPFALGCGAVLSII